MKKLKYPKGYHLEVVSWENDADIYKVISYHSTNKELVLALYKMCSELFVSKNNSKIGIGNSCFHEQCFMQAVDYIEDKPILWMDKKPETNEDFFNIVLEWGHTLLDSSEFYLFRVFERGEIFYIEEDIWVDVIQT